MAEDLTNAKRTYWTSRYCTFDSLDGVGQNRLKVLGDSVGLDRIVFASADVEQDVELAVVVDDADIPDLESMVLVFWWECTHWLRRPQRVSITRT